MHTYVLCTCMYLYNVLCAHLDEHEKIQKKTFTKWVQSHLRKATGRVPPLEDLYTDLRDGCVLLKLLEILSGENPVSYIALSIS